MRLDKRQIERIGPFAREPDELTQVLEARAVLDENQVHATVRQVGECRDAIWRLVIAARHHGPSHAVVLTL